MLMRVRGDGPDIEPPALGISPPLGYAAGDGFDALKAHFADLRHEQLHAYFIDTGHDRPLNGIHFRGAFDHVDFDPRLIFSQALMFGASGIVLAHNHPSGEPTPSSRDIAVTRQIHQGCALLGLRLYDHIIIASDQHFSFRAEGLL